MNRFLLTAVTAAVLLVPSSSALAASGDLDTTFSGDGRALIDFGAIESASGVAVQPDGKIVLAGASRAAGGKDDFLVARLNRDGTPDATFSDDGRIVFSFGLSGATTNDKARAVALGSDGSIVVTGVTEGNAGDGNGTDTAVARLTPGGELDQSFDGDGKQTIHYGQNDDGVDVAVQGDGSVVVGSTALIGNDRDFGVARLTSAGRPDTTWRGTGRTTTHFGGDEELRGIALTPDGGVVAVGMFQFVGGSTDTAIARYLPDGKLDESGFAGRGKATVSLAGKDAATDVAVQPDGKIVIAAEDTGKNAQGFVARFTSSGAFDDGYADHGTAQTSVSRPHDFRALALTPRSHAVAVGQVSGGPIPTDFVSAEFEPTGTPDRTYPQSNGVGGADFGGSEAANAVAISGNHAIAVGQAGGDIPVASIEIDEPAPPAPAPESGPEPVEPAQEQPSPGAPTAPAPTPDTVAPVVSKLKLTAGRGTEKGTFKVSEQATVTVTLQRKVKRSGRTRLVAARTITLNGKAGPNAFKLKKLKPGSYRVTLRATDGAGNASKPVRQSFVLKKKRR